jgi:hypothetical protein
MSNIHVYCGIEDLNLTVPQRQTILGQLEALGVSNNDPQPCLRNHWRVRTDNKALIMEALFDDNTITVAAIKQRLATLFSVDVSLISSSVITPTFAVLPSPVVTFTFSAVNYLRMVSFGGSGATWDQSRIEANAYLLANIGAWS